MVFRGVPGVPGGPEGVTEGVPAQKQGSRGSQPVTSLTRGSRVRDPTSTMSQFNRIRDADQPEMYMCSSQTHTRIQSSGGPKGVATKSSGSETYRGHRGSNRAPRSMRLERSVGYYGSPNPVVPMR